MLICIDSCIFIRGLQGDADAARLLDTVSPDVVLVIPHLIAMEVVRNLSTPEQVRCFYGLFRDQDLAFIVYEPVPAELVSKYSQLGLRAKGDAFIGAFVEWLNIDWLISDNRHFLQELDTEAFRVLDAAGFLLLLERRAHSGRGE